MSTDSFLYDTMNNVGTTVFPGVPYGKSTNQDIPGFAQLMEAMLQNPQWEQAVSADRAWAESQAQKQMDFQREMSSTAYQRAVADLQKAGLNPALAYSQGPASTTSGAMADTSSSRQKSDLEREKNMFLLLFNLITNATNLTNGVLKALTI